MNQKPIDNSKRHFEQLENRHKLAYEKTANIAYNAGIKDFRLIVPYERYAMIVLWYNHKHGYKSKYIDIAGMLIKNPYTGYNDIIG